MAVTRRTSTAEFSLRRHEGEKLGHVSFEQSTVCSAFPGGAATALEPCSLAEADVAKVSAITKPRASGEAFIWLSFLISISTAYRAACSVDDAKVNSPSAGAVRHAESCGRDVGAARWPSSSAFA